jgi:hypothetical protein
MTFDRQPQRVDRDVSFTPFDLFPGIIASWSAGFRPLHRLTVDDGHRRGGAFAFCLTHRHDQNGDHLFPKPAVAPGVKAVLHGCERREVFRQIPPGITRLPWDTRRQTLASGSGIGMVSGGEPARARSAGSPDRPAIEPRRADAGTWSPHLPSPLGIAFPRKPAGV